jgi:hypothetical protein
MSTTSIGTLSDMPDFVIPPINRNSIARLIERQNAENGVVDDDGIISLLGKLMHSVHIDLVLANAA